MIVICPNCTTRLQLEASKVPSRAFSVRCPKCQHIVNAQPPPQTSQRDAVTAVSDPPASTRAQQPGGGVASAATPAAVEPPPNDTAATPESEVLRLLASLLTREGGASALRHGAERRRALVCAGSTNGGEIARTLARGGFDVFAPDNVPMACEALREGNVAVVVLDPEFDVRERGQAAICGELAAMRMPERRRVVFVQMSDAARTGDAHAAFASGVNLVFNTKDVRELPFVLQKNLRDLNELYRDFNKALGVAEL